MGNNKFSKSNAFVTTVFIIIAISYFSVNKLYATTYYIDNNSGNDTNTGRLTTQAWKSLNKVNATTFQAGDSILFKSGGVWVGKLNPKGSGNANYPIVIDKYGAGVKPLIDGNGMTGTGVVYLYNQAYWEINNLEITNFSNTEGDRRGVRIEINEGIGVVNHIYLRNLQIHHISGKVGQDRTHKRTSGIGFAVLAATNAEARFNDILVENCVINDCQNQGIITECVDGDGYQPQSPEWNRMKITNARIRNNTIYNISKNAMIIRLFEGGIVENNVCYNTANGISGNTMFTAACDGTIFQYNEGYLNNSPDADGSMYDADLRSPNTIWQYSYSHDNSHGLFWTCTVQEDANIVCRYNISQNDKGIIFCINYPVTSVSVYNNTVYIPQQLSPIIISERNNGNVTGQANTRTYNFKNNLIYNLSPSATYLWNATNYSRTYEANCFYGIHPSNEPNDAKKITANPLMVNPGSGTIGLNTLEGYKLQANSPCINAGVVIPNNGNQDFFGNTLYNGLPDIGANEYKVLTPLLDVFSKGYGFQVSANPFRIGGELFILSDYCQNDKLKIAIYNQKGQNIYKKSFKSGMNNYSVGNPFDSTGVYVLKVDLGKTVLSKKIIVI